MILIGISTHYIVILQTNDIWMSWEALGRDIKKNNPKTEDFNKKVSVVALCPLSACRCCSKGGKKIVLIAFLGKLRINPEKLMNTSL